MAFPNPRCVEISRIQKCGYDLATFAVDEGRADIWSEDWNFLAKWALVARSPRKAGDADMDAFATESRCRCLVDRLHRDKVGAGGTKCRARPRSAAWSTYGACQAAHRTTRTERS